MSLNAPPSTATLEARLAQVEQAIVALSAEVDIARSEARSAQAALAAAPGPVND